MILPQVMLIRRKTDVAQAPFKWGAKQGGEVAHATIIQRVQDDSPRLDKRIRLDLCTQRQSGGKSHQEPTLDKHIAERK